MNHLYRLVFNPALKTVQVVSELVTGSRPGRASSPANARALAVHLLVPALALACSSVAQAAGPAGWNEWRGTSINWFTPGNWSRGTPTLGGVASYIDDNRYAEISSGQGMSNHLHVGYAGYGRLGIISGGKLRSQTIFMAHDVGSSALVEIDGAGSTWRSDTTIGVGHQGHGDLLVSNAGTLDVGLDSYVGAAPTGSGVVIVTGAGSQFLTGRALLVGNEGTGQVRIQNRAAMTSGEGWLGNFANSSGAVDISGAGSTWVNTGNLHIGNRGTGVVSVTHGGSVQTGSAIWLGRQLNAGVRSSGTLQVDTGGMFTGTDMMVVGGAGDGRVDVRGGGSVNIGNAVTLAEQLGSTGSVLVTGAGSQWRSGSLRIGANADADFTVQDGAFASVRERIEIALMGTSSSRLTIGNAAMLQVGDGTSGEIIAGSGNGAVVMNGGTLQGNGALMVNADMQMQADSIVQSTDTIDLWGRVSGAGQLRKAGSGTLNLHSANTHAGGVRVDAGALQLNHDLAAGTGTLVMHDATTLGFGLPTRLVANAIRLQGAVNVAALANQTVTLSGAIDDGAGSGRLRKTGAGTLVLSAANSYSGGTQVDAGTLAVSRTGAAGTGELLLADGTTLDVVADGVALGNAVVLDGSSTVNVGAGSARLTGVVRDGSGSGTLIKTGRGALTLEAASAHSGGTQVLVGALLLGNDKATGSGTLSLADATQLGFTRGNLDIANAVALDRNVVVAVGNGQDSRISGVIGNGSSSGHLLKQGTGTLTLSGSNTYSGGTSIGSGMLKIEKNDALGTGAVDISSGGSLGLAGNALVLGNDISLAGAAGLVVWPGSSTLAGVIGDGALPGMLLKSGAGELTLSSANSFSGGVQMAQGALTLGNDRAAGTGMLQMGDYTQLRFGRTGLDIANDLQLGSDVTVSVADAAQLSGVISDLGRGGQLVKTGAGTLTVSGNNRYSGGTRLSQGTLAVSGTAALGSGTLEMRAGTTLALSGDAPALANAVTIDGEGRFDVASGSATLSGVLSDGATGGGTIVMSAAVMSAAVAPMAMPTAPGMLVKTGAGELVLTADNRYSGGTRIDAGTLALQGAAAVAGDIEIAAGAGLELARASDTRFSGVLSGAGEVRKRDVGTLLLTADSSGFSGQTLIQSGQLFVQGRLGGALTLASGTLLGGTGTLGTVSLVDGATLAPGLAGQIGTLNVVGNLTFSQGARYVADVAADGRNDRVHVAGTALLGNAGTVAVAQGSDWAPSMRYTLLTADQAVQGVFAGVSSNFAFLDPRLEYDANNVYLTLARNDIAIPDIEIAFPEVQLNSNQAQVASAVEALGSGAAVYDAVVRLEVAQVAPAFDSLSGEIHAAHRGTLIQNRFLHDGIDRHLDGAAMGGEIAPGVHAWVAGSGGQQRKDGSAENAGLRASQHGTMAGAGWRMGESLEVGVAVGQQQLASRLTLRDARAETDTTEYGIYGQYHLQGLSLRAGLTRADHRTDSTRTAQVGSSLSERLVAREDATGTTAFVRAGWSFGGPGLQWTPEVELAQVRLRSDGSQERGGNSALQLDAGTARYRTGLAALRADWDISGGECDRAALTARVGWQVAGGDRLPLADARFVGGTQSFSIAGAPLARHSALAQLGVAVSPTDSSRVSLQMQGRRGDGERDLGAQLDWSVVF